LNLYYNKKHTIKQYEFERFRFFGFFKWLIKYNKYVVFNLIKGIYL